MHKLVLFRLLYITTLCNYFNFQLLEALLKALVESIQSSVKNVSFAALFLSVQHIQTATKLITGLFRLLPPNLAKQKVTFWDF